MKKDLAYLKVRERFDPGGQKVDLREVINYTGVSEEEALKLALHCRTLIAEEWRKKDPKSPAECNTFYTETPLYVWDLYTWPHDPQMWNLFDAVITGDERVLDYGCGIGDVAIYLAEKGCEVTAVDLKDSKTLDFCMWRVYQRKLGNKITFSFDPNEDKYDVVLAIDVLEHLHFPLRYAVDLGNVLFPYPKKSWFFATPSFENYGGNYPQHLEENFWLKKHWAEAMYSLAFVPEQPIKDYYPIWRPLFGTKEI